MLMMTVLFVLHMLFTSCVILCFKTGMIKACNSTKVISARSGELLSPNYPGNYTNNLECTWEIQSPNGGWIVLNFNVFNLELVRSCIYDSLQIYDGIGDSRKSFMQKTCGTGMENRTVVTSSKEITIYFETDATVVKKGFNITWSTCGGDFVNQETPVTSPKLCCYYGRLICTYNLSVPGNMSAIQVNFSKTAFDSSTRGCLIQISDSRNKQIGRVCTKTDPKVYDFNTNEIQLSVTSIYRSVAVLNFTFKGYNRTTTPCSKRITTEQYGTIYSPRFPGNYEDGLYCTWEIKAANQGRIMLTFHEFDIEYDKECSFDYLMIYVGSMDATNVLVNKACGTEMRRKTVVSTSDTVFVVFKTDSSVNDQGFNITWESCGGNFISRSYSLSLPKFHYDHEPITCSYYLMVAENTSSIEIDMSNAEPDPYNGTCLIKISDSEKKYFGQICTNSDPRIYTFNTRELKLDFTVVYLHNTDLIISVREFDGVLESCDRSFTTAKSGTISYYWDEKNDLVCTWIISLSNVGQIALLFQEFNIGNDMNCSAESLTIFEGPADNASILVNGTCGTSIENTTVTSFSDRVVVVLKTGNSEEKRGIRISWQSCERGHYGRDCAETCGHCIDSTHCDPKTGVCSKGCDYGYTGDLCKNSCEEGRYGQDCAEQCGHCIDSTHCDPKTGVCSKGCDEGYTGDFCKNCEIQDDSNLMLTIAGISGLIVILLLSIAVLGLCLRLKRVNQLQTFREGNEEFRMSDRETTNEVRYVSGTCRALDLSKQPEDDISLEDYEDVANYAENLEIYENIPEEESQSNHVRDEGLVNDCIVGDDEIYEEI